MDVIERGLGSIAELALSAESLHAFEMGWLEQLRPILGFDAACSVWSGSDGAVVEATGVGYDEASLRARFPEYMGELSQEEVLRFSGAEPAIDTDVVSAPRRERLTVYRELLAPIHVSCFLTNVWKSRFGVFGFHFARTGRARSFSRDEASLLGRLAPCIKLGQALLAAEHGASGARAATDWWADAWNLSPKEREAARFVERGLSNPEIAGLMGVSRYTVRNHLASIFKKAEVSSRAELVFAMTASTSGERARRTTGRSEPWRAFIARAAPR